MLREQSTDWLCADYPSAKMVITGDPAAVRAELERRGAISPAEWPAIDAGKVGYGMSQCAVEAVWGTPILKSHVHSAAGEIEVWAYPSASAVFTAGKVTSYTEPP